MASDANKVWRIVAAEDVARRRRADGAAGRAHRPVRRRRRPLAGADHRVGPDDRRGRAVERRRAAPAATDVRGDLHLQPRRRLPQHPAAMADDPGACGVVESVVVVDQGSDPLESRPRFAAVGERLGPRLRYVRQPNLGGAGGFTRGLFDATARRPGRRPRRPAHGRRRAARAGDPRPAHGVRDLHDAPDDRRRADAQPAAPRAPAHQRRVRRARDAAGGARRYPGR